MNPLANTHRNKDTPVPYLIDTAFVIATTSLWPLHAYTVREIKKIKSMIRKHFLAISFPYDAYREMSYAILITKYILINDKNYSFPVIPHKGIRKLINPCYPFSQKWYNRKLQAMEINLAHSRNFKYLADALIDMQAIPADFDYAYWVRWFRVRDFIGELQIFYQCIAILNIQKIQAENES